MFRLKLTIILLVITITLLVSIIYAFNLNMTTKPFNPENATCFDDERSINQKFLQEIVGNMNMEADPCEDFYDYACGNWTEESNYIKSFDQIVASMLEKLQSKDSDEKTELNEAYKKANLFYNSCLSAWTYDYTEFLQLVEPAAQQKWPILKKRNSKPWNFENFVWWKVLAKLQSYNLKIIFDLTSDFVPEKSDSYILAINVNAYNMEKIAKLPRDILVDLGYNTSVRRKLLIWELQAFESKLLNVIDDKNDTAKQQAFKIHCDMEINYEIDESTECDNGTELMSLNELQTVLPGIEWQEYFNIQLQGTNLKLPKNTKFFTLYNVDVLQRVMQFLENTSKETLALYFMTNFLIHLHDTLNEHIDDINEKCAYVVQTSMPLAVDYLYEENYYGAIRAESDEVINNVYQGLKAKLNELFKQNHFNLTANEIEHLQRKNQKMRLNIGNLPENKTIDFLVDFYADVNISAGHNFYHNHLELLRHKNLLEYRMFIADYKNKTNIFKTFDHTGTSHFSPNYTPKDNLIAIGFPDLRFPVYHHKSHNVFHGNLLFTLGHEIFHGFGTKYLKIDDNGQYNTLMENIGRKKNFLDNLKCLKQHVTAGIEERVADISGLRLTIEAFLNSLPVNVQNCSILSSAMSYRKLFFVQILQYYCLQDVDEYIDLNAGVHDPADYRVTYLSANTRELLDEFNCTKKKTPISSEKICQLW